MSNVQTTRSAERHNVAVPDWVMAQANPAVTPPEHMATHPFGFIDQRVMHDGSGEARGLEVARVHDQLIRNFDFGGPKRFFRDHMLEFCAPQEHRKPDYEAVRATLAERAEAANAISKSFRDDVRSYQTAAVGRNGPRQLPRLSELHKGGAISKSILDVGTATNFSSITGGQSLGYFSLDTRMARGTVRPDSFTLYQALPKSAAFQPVDYFAYIDDPGGPLPGSAFAGFSSVQSGTLTSDSGLYTLQNVVLKLALDGRAMTMALAAQNSFVNIPEQENANAALIVLGSVNWGSYFGNPTNFANQPVGLANSIPTANQFSFQTFSTNNASLNGWSIPQTLYNMIYETAGVVTSWGTFGRITHAFMTPVAMGSLQGLVTTTLNNIATVLTREQRMMPGVVVDGDLQGMRTRMGLIQFALDLFITARDKPAQAQVRSNGTNPATASNPTPPASVTVTLSGAASTGSQWGIGAGSPFLASGSWGTARYAYGVASTDANMNESTLTWSAVVSGITATGAYLVAIAPPVAADATAFRVFRTGDGGFASGANSPSAVRFVGTILSAGTGTVTFVDNNTYIPGSETIFLLDMREEDFALDYRYLLPLTRIELFAQNLYMPWAVAHIGAIRNRIPKFHAVITGYVPDSPAWSPYTQNA